MHRAMNQRPAYLRPYDRAAAKHGGGFGALLWASPATQAARFDALCRLVNFRDRIVLDVGCGRADLLDHLTAINQTPSLYIGLEAVPALVKAARAKVRAGVQILEADFIAEPHRMFVGADVIVFSGSLNTVPDESFFGTLTRAFEAATQAVVFNFLCSPSLAAADYLSWRASAEVLGFAANLASQIELLDDYLHGDCAICMTK